MSNANVSLILYDDNGVQTGTGSGVLIAPQTVLTAAHLVAGKGKWTVTSADGKQKVNGLRAQTFDWKRYDSLNAHPRKHDVAVIFLDRPIKVASYPKIATATQATGEPVMRVRGQGNSFSFVEGSLDRVRQMPNAYQVSMPASETLDTGGAVVNGKGEIVGVVTGRGMQTGKLYIAKLGEVVGWLSDKATCGGVSAGSALSIRTVGVPTPKDGCTKDGGAGGTSSSGGSSSGSTSSSSGSTSSSSGASGSSSGASGGSSGVNGSNEGTPTCNEGGGYEYPGGGGAKGTSEATGVNGGSTTGTVPGGSGTGGGSGDGSGDGSGTGGGSTTGTSGGSTTGTVPGGSSGTGGAGSGDGSGTGGGSTTGTNGGSTTGNIPGGGGGAGGSAGADEEVCEGESDNPDVCPPETTNCEGSECGGANAPADTTIDYGDCGCKPSSGSGSIILR